MFARSCVARIDRVSFRLSGIVRVALLYVTLRVIKICVVFECLGVIHWLRVLELASDCWRLCPSSVVFRWRLCPSRCCLRVVRVGSRALLIQRERAGHMCPRIDEEERFVLEKVAAVMRAAR